MMKQLLLVAAGGSLGALARYGVSLMAARAAFPAFYGTVLVNIVGSLLIGVLYVAIVERGWLHPDWRSVLMVGLLGAFTTFSTFSLEAVALLEQGRWPLAAIYVTGSVVLCIAGCALGMMLARTGFAG